MTSFLQQCTLNKSIYQHNRISRLAHTLISERLAWSYIKCIGYPLLFRSDTPSSVGGQGVKVCSLITTDNASPPHESAHCSCTMSLRARAKVAWLCLHLPRTCYSIPVVSVTTQYHFVIDFKAMFAIFQIYVICLSLEFKNSLNVM